MIKLLHAGITEQVLGAFQDVYREHGFGFLENVYVNSMVIELGARGLSVKREAPTEVLYRGVVVGRYRADLIVEDRVLLEVKAAKTITNADERQLLNYLKASRIAVGLLLHFGPEPKVLRRVMSRHR